MLEFIADQVDVGASLNKLAQYQTRLRTVAALNDYAAPESSISLPGDSHILQAVQDTAGGFKLDKLRYVVIIGIGGSSLGAKAIYDALWGGFDALQPGRFPKLLFAETSHPGWLQHASHLLRGLEADEVVVVLVSKSGTTTETIANFEILMHDRNFPVVTITDEGSALWEAATKKGWPSLPIPQMVGGRFSVFSAVGLFPLLLVGIDVEAVLRGARSLRDQSLAGEVVASDPARSAALLYQYLLAGKTIYDTFIFEPELESTGKWYRQLMGESIGKERDRQGRVVHTGITPTVSVGSTDLHSVGQLYLGGPRDKYTTFIASAQTDEVVVPSARLLGDLVPMISGKSASQIMEAILAGTRAAYQQAGLPFSQLILETVSPETIGALLQFKMLEMMYLAELLNVNCFDQPSVEDYKVVTRQILEG